MRGRRCRNGSREPLRQQLRPGRGLPETGAVVEALVAAGILQHERREALCPGLRQQALALAQVLFERDP